MERNDAFKALRLDQSADGRMVENAYWTLVRQAQRRGENPTEAGHEIDRLNEAYALLSPERRTSGRAPAAVRPHASSVPLLDGIADWFAEEALRTRARWSRRNPEIGIIGGATLLLMVLALGAGASVWATFVATLLTFVAIWAPWRRTG